MERPMKLFEVTCAACNQALSIREPLADPDVEDSADLVVECLYCQKNVKVALPLKYTKTKTVMRLESVKT